MLILADNNMQYSDNLIEMLVKHSLQRSILIVILKLLKSYFKLLHLF